MYFVEQCCGSSDADSIRKIVVIDDPISSLSSHHIFNISSLIMDKFSRTEDHFHKVLLLTHSLYFYSEIRRCLKLAQKDSKLQQFRINKSNNSSKISLTKKDEILNAYQEFWGIVKSDEYVFPVANAMRQILEYFFGFIHSENYKKTLKKLLKEKYEFFDSFFRYIDRGSHSDTSNTDVMDIGDFDIKWVRAQFKEIFRQTGYETHYTAMMEESNTSNIS